MLRVENFDFAKNIREIETLKVGMLSAVCEVYELMQDVSGGNEALGEALAAVVCAAQALAGKVGLPPGEMERRVQQRMRTPGS